MKLSLFLNENDDANLFCKCGKHWMKRLTRKDKYGQTIRYECPVCHSKTNWHTSDRNASIAWDQEKEQNYEGSKTKE